MRTPLLPRLRLSLASAPPRTFTAAAAVRFNSSRPQTPDFYSLFPGSIPHGAPPAGPFAVDLRALQREFFALQQKSHPDTPAHVRSLDGPSSAFINRAYSTLRDPLLRAQYLLARRGIDVADDETLKIDDQELLMEVLEAQEEVLEASSEEDLEPLHSRNRERIEKSLKALEKAFEEDDLETAKREAVRLRYWRNVEETLKAWEKGKGPHVLQH